MDQQVKKKETNPNKYGYEVPSSLRRNAVLSKESVLTNVKFDDFAFVDEHDLKKIKELYYEAKEYYTHYITNYRCMRRAREMVLEMLEKAKQKEITSGTIKFTLYETITTVSKSRIMEAVREILKNLEDRDDFTTILNEKCTSIQKLLETDYPASLKMGDPEIARKISVIPETNNPIDVLLGYALTAQNTKANTSTYKQLMSDIRVILKSYVESTKKTIKVNLDNGEYILARMNFKNVSSIADTKLHDVISIFCENRPYQVNELQLQFYDCLIRIKAVRRRKAIKSSIDDREEDHSI